MKDPTHKVSSWTVKPQMNAKAEKILWRLKAKTEHGILQNKIHVIGQKIGQKMVPDLIAIPQQSAGDAHCTSKIQTQAKPSHARAWFGNLPPQARLLHTLCGSWKRNTFSVTKEQRFETRRN